MMCAFHDSNYNGFGDMCGQTNVPILVVGIYRWPCTVAECNIVIVYL